MSSGSPVEDKPDDMANTTGTRPIPDPTVLTTNLVDRAVKSERDRTDGQFAIRDERLTAIDLATTHRHTEFERMIGYERELTAQRFASLDFRTAEQKADTKAAVDAALQAAKELVALQTEAADKNTAKSEAAFAKQIDALGVIQGNATRSSDEKIDDLKSRMDRIEATRIGSNEQRTEHRAGNAALYAAVAIAVTLLLAAITIVGFVADNRP